MNKEFTLLKNILLSSDPLDQIMQNEDYLFSLIPELKRCKGFKQNNHWHVFDVYFHTLDVIYNTPNDLALRLAALFHDLGKPLTYVEDANKVGHFPKHYEKSLEIFNSYINKLEIDEKLASEVAFLIYNHDLEYDKIKWLNNSKKIKLKILYLKRADLLAQNMKYHYLVKDIDKKIDSVKKSKIKKPKK